MGLTLLLGFLPGFKLPGFLKSPLFWKVAAMVAAAFFIWHKATISANARWQLKLVQETAQLKARSTALINEQRDADMKRIFELEATNHELEMLNGELAKQRSQKKNKLSASCNLCRIPRGRSPHRLRRKQAEF